MEWFSKIVLILLIIGGLNWGLVGAYHFDLVAFLFKPMSVLSRSIYMLVGLAALWELFMVLGSIKDLTK